MNLNIILPMLSGLVGVLIGSILDYIFLGKSQKKQFVNNYVDRFHDKLNHLIGYAKELLDKPEAYNNRFFNIYYDDTVQSLDNFKPILKKAHKGIIDTIKLKLEEAGERFSLDVPFETILNDEDDEDVRGEFLMILGSTTREAHAAISKLLC